MPIYGTARFSVKPEALDRCLSDVLYPATLGGVTFERFCPVDPA